MLLTSFHAVNIFSLFFLFIACWKIWICPLCTAWIDVSVSMRYFNVTWALHRKSRYINSFSTLRRKFQVFFQSDFLGFGWSKIGLGSLECSFQGLPFQCATFSELGPQKTTGSRKYRSKINEICLDVIERVIKHFHCVGVLMNLRNLLSFVLFHTVVKQRL